MSLFSRLVSYTFLLLVAVLGVTTITVSQWAIFNVEDRLSVQTNNSIGVFAAALSLQNLDDPQVLAATCRGLDTIPDLYEFREIALYDAAGVRRCYQTNTPAPPNAPAWFISNLNIEIFPSSKPVQQNWVTWQLVGTPYEANAYDELWRLTITTFWSIAIVFFAASVVGLWALNQLVNSLRAVVQQAKNIGQRRFTTIAIPNTTEFAAVARSMNNLSDRVRAMLSDEAELLLQKKESYDFDDITGLLNRETFIEQFGARMHRESEESVGSVALIRILKLAEMNREYGRELIDNLLKDVGAALNQLSGHQHYGGYFTVGRLNGADMCAVATNERNPKNLADTMQRKVMSVLREHNIDRDYTVAAACIEFELGQNTGDLLSAMDGALAQSELQAGAPIVPAQAVKNISPNRANQHFWQANLALALERGDLRLAWFPVIGNDESVLHLEGMARLSIEGQDYSAADFMPWIFRLDLGQSFDRAVVSDALRILPTRGERLHVNLSTRSLEGLEFSSWLDDQLARSSADVARFGIEISETAVITAYSSFTTLMEVIKPYGCQIGIEHMGFRPEIIAELGNLGPDYLKVDSLYTQNLTTNQVNRSVLTSFSGVARSLGIPCIAEGISTTEDVSEAFNLGARGVSGEAVGLGAPDSEY